MRPSFGIALLATACTCSGPDREASVVRAELSDTESLEILGDWPGLPVFAPGRRQKQSSADRLTGERTELVLWEHGNRDMNNFVCASSDADAPPSQVRFNYDLASCPEHYVRGVVLARFEGSGRLARIWLTAASFRNAPPDREQLRIWIDDVANPAVDVPLRDALDGSAGEMFAPPFGAGSSRRMAWYYPLVFSKKLVIALDRLGGDDLYFHQTDVVLDESPRARHADAERSPARQAALRLLRAAAPQAGSVRAKTLALASGEKANAFELEGPATLVKTQLRVRGGIEALRAVMLEVRWDGEAAPSIALPIVELFGAFDAPPEISGHVLGSRIDGGFVELWLSLPMPFAKQSSWMVENRSDAPVEIELDLSVAPGVPARAWGHLQTERFETAAPGPSLHPIAAAKGRGRLAGVCMAMHGHGMMEGGHRGHPMHFLEGDEILKIDGRTLGGTGTEDYFNGAFYFDDGPSATPFAQVWGISANPVGGQVSACRWHILGDTIDTSESLEAALEVGPGVPDVLDRFRSVAYLYR